MAICHLCTYMYIYVTQLTYPVATNLLNIFDLINLLLGAANLTHEDGKLIFQVIITLATNA